MGTDGEKMLIRESLHIRVIRVIRGSIKLLLGAVISSTTLLPSLGATDSTTTTLVPALGWDIKKQGGFPVSLASDASGNIWVGTEGNGLWKYDATKKAWTQFTTKDGLGDDCVYALAFDKQNRLWAGHLNHGVSVYNGEKWRNYGLVDGPIGDRVFAIAASPKDGDVWIATDMGLARYSEQRQDWDYYTRASGLPSDQIQCLTFDYSGQLFAGTQCDGLAIASPDDDYTKWTSVIAPRSIPPEINGAQLDSNFVNAIQAFDQPTTKGAPRSLVVVATASGAAFRVGANRWNLLRGEDWKHYGGSIPYNDHVVAPAAEDWMTTLGTPGTRLWMGYRKSGVESRILDKPASPEILAALAKPAAVVIRAILAPPGQPPLVAAYDPAAGGLLTLATDTSAAPDSTGTASPPPIQPSPPLPAPAQPPTIADTQALGSQIAKLSDRIAPGEAYYLADDWRTQGDWVGRYGSGYVKLCGMADKPEPTKTGTGIAIVDQDYSLEPGYDVKVQMGPHFQPNFSETSDSQRSAAWIRRDNQSSDDLRSLYDPILGHRRDAAEDDRSEDTKLYPESYNGPDLWVRVKVPEGVDCLALYFVNNDAHAVSGAQYRDYDVQVVPDQDSDSRVQAEIDSGNFLVRTRVTDFWGGVYKQFMIRGPASYVVRIGRNRSFGTRLQAVFLDRVDIEAPDNPPRLPGFVNAPYDPPNAPDDYTPTPLADAALRLWTQLDESLPLRGAIPLQMPFHLWSYRAAIAGGAAPAVLEHLRWEISIWNPDDRKKFDAAMKAAYDTIK